MEIHIASKEQVVYPSGNDDTDAIMKVANNLGAGHGVVLITGETYSISQPLVLPPNIHLLSEYDYATINWIGEDIAGPAIKLDNAQIRNISLNSFNKADGIEIFARRYEPCAYHVCVRAAKTCGFYAKDCWGSMFEHVTVRSSNTCAIRFERCNSAICDNLRSHGHLSGMMLELINSNQMLFRNVISEGSSYVGNVILLRSIYDVEFNSMRFESNTFDETCYLFENRLWDETLEYKGKGVRVKGLSFHRGQSVKLWKGIRSLKLRDSELFGNINMSDIHLA